MSVQKLAQELVQKTAVFSPESMDPDMKKNIAQTMLMPLYCGEIAFSTRIKQEG